MKALTVAKARKILNSPGVMVVAQVNINGDDVMNIPLSKKAAWEAMKALEGKTVTSWTYIEDHQILVIG